MTLRSRSRRHRSPPQIAFVQIFSPVLSGCLERRACTYKVSPRLSHSPVHVSPPGNFSRKREAGAAGFQTTDLFFHVAIYFFTAACTGWMSKGNLRRVKQTTAFLTLTSLFRLFSTVLYYFSFSSSFFFYFFLNPHSIRLRVFYWRPMTNGYWNKVMWRAGANVAKHFETG